MQIPKIALEGDRVRRIRDLLKMYSVIIFKEEITDREVQVLSEYVLYGVTEQAFKAIRLNYNIEDNNRRQIDSRLQKKGLLQFKPHRQGKELHVDLKSIRDNFVNGNEKFIILQVWN